MPRKGYRKCVKCGRNRAERYFTSSRGRICETCRRRIRSKTAHENRVVATYGLKKGEYDKLLEAQGGGCAICGNKPRGNLDVDHDHETGLVRGLLCKSDNRKVLPYSRNDPERLRAAADYLENPPALKFLGERYYQGDDSRGRRRVKRSQQRRSE